MGTVMKILYLPLFLSAAALASETTLEQCRAIADPSARLACYDGLPLPANAGGPTAKVESKARLPETPAQFGLSREVTPSVDLASIESTIPGHFDGCIREGGSGSPTDRSGRWRKRPPVCTIWTTPR